MKPKVIVVCGPTATGKSDFAVWLAQKIQKKVAGKSHINVEIISADSRQVYKGLDIGSGKITKKEMAGIPHHLLDVCSPKKIYSADQYKKDALKAINKIISKNTKHGSREILNIPIVCGGTGFYIDALINNVVFPDVQINPELRKKLEKKSAEQLFAMLYKLDVRRASDISDKNEINNRVRLIRAIEIAKALGKVPTIQADSPFDAMWIGLSVSPEKLKRNIEKRLVTRIKAGMITEVRKLHTNGVSWKRLNELGLEYRYVALFLQNKITKQEMIEKLNVEIFKYAKRQMTWFKRNKNILWIDPKQKTSTQKKVNEFLLS